MNILNTSIVSNTEMIKNYKDCRKKAEKLNKIFILKNNQPDAVLFSINKYEKLSEFIEYLDNCRATISSLLKSYLYSKFFSA